MIVKELKKLLESYEDDYHVVIAVVPIAGQIIVPAQGQKFELHDGWCDRYGALNLIATTPADAIDPMLKSENDL